MIEWIGEYISDLVAPVYSPTSSKPDNGESEDDDTVPVTSGHRPTRVLVTSLPAVQDYNPHYLKHMFEETAGGKVVAMDIDSLNKSAIVEYDKAEAVMQCLLRQPLKIEDKELKVQIYYPHSSHPSTDDAVEVMGVHKGMPIELLKLYFENNRRSGGGKVVKITLNAIGSTAVVKFAHKQAAWNVVFKQRHVINGTEVRVQYLKPRLSFGQAMRHGLLDQNDNVKVCGIWGCCHLADGYLVLTDVRNNTVELLDAATYTLQHRYILSDPPSSVCSTGTSTAAVATCQHRVAWQGRPACKGGVQLLKVENMELKSTATFYTDHMCMGITCLDDELFLSDGNDSVLVYDMSGMPIRKLTGMPFTPLHIATHPDGSLYVAGGKGLFQINKQGERLSEFVDKHLKCLSGVCVDKSGRVFITFKDSNCVCHLDGFGVLWKIGTATGGLKYPRSVCFNEGTSSVVVGDEHCKHITVFNVRDNMAGTERVYTVK